MNKIIVFILFLIFSFSEIIHTQPINNEEIDKVFKEAVELYSTGNFREALRLFERISEDYTYNSKTTASLFFKSKILILIKNYSQAESLLKDFVRKYPTSKYIDEVKLELAKVYFEKNEYQESFSELIGLYTSTKSVAFAQEAKKFSEGIALQYLTVSKLKSFNDSSRDNKVKPFLLLLLGKLYLNDGNRTAASETFSKLAKSYPDSQEKIEAERFLSGLNSETRPAIEQQTLIGVLLPLSGIENSEELSASREILEGIKFAISEFNNERQGKIGLVVFDTENKKDKISEIKRQVEFNSSVKLLIGPVFSSEVSLALEEFKNSDIPIISPTATDNDLTQINKNFFQANPNFVVRAKTMAQYIYYVENKRRIAVLNSIDGYSPLLAAEFVSEFNRIGGEVTAKSTYKSGTMFSGNQMREFSSSLSDTEGIYIPLSDRMDAPLILSQLVLNGINVPIYGNQDWFQAKGFETSPELSNKLTITSDYFIDYNSTIYWEFNKQFKSKAKIEANRNVLYGYDTAKYVLTVLRNISPERSNIISKIKSGVSINGIHNNIIFDNNRVNRFMNIIKYNDGIFELSDKFKANL